jgi:uncharacterized membrane protein
MDFNLADTLALLYFLAAWIGYSILIEQTDHGRSSLNSLMNRYRDEWMEELLVRPMRMVDAQVTAALQNGTAFFASTSLLAIGGSLAMLRVPQETLSVVAWLPFGEVPTQTVWEAKILGLAVIFVYAFFKFAWSYRLYNYVAILVGAAPQPKARHSKRARQFVERTARICVDAGRHFNRGQRAFFFALAYLGWFISAYVFMAATAAVLYVIWRRQFASDAIAALDDR